jgi:hypothetical protein
MLQAWQYKALTTRDVTINLDKKYNPRLDKKYNPRFNLEQKDKIKDRVVSPQATSKSAHNEILTWSTSK